MIVRLAGLVVVATVGTASPFAYAQDVPAAARVSFGGDASATLSPADTRAFFNYTDYDANVLRNARFRLAGTFRLTQALSAIVEVRTDAAAGAEASAAFLRWELPGGGFVVQAGRIPPLVGAFPRRAYSRDNAVLGQPLAFQYVTSLRPDALPTSADDVLALRGRGWLPTYPVGSQDPEPGVPLVSASSWDTGLEVSWRHGPVEAAAAVTRGSPAVPVVRETNDALGISGRATVQLPLGLVVGGSAARGSWMEDEVLRVLPDRDPGTDQHVLGLELEAGDGPWLVRAEVLRSRFVLPLASLPESRLSLGATAGYVEARYRLRPRWHVGLRADRLTFSRLQSDRPDVGMVAWEAPVTRIEGAVSFRATRQIDLRVGWQHNWRADGRVRRLGYPAAGAFFWF